MFYSLVASFALLCPIEVLHNAHHVSCLGRCVATKLAAREVAKRKHVSSEESEPAKVPRVDGAANAESNSADAAEDAAEAEALAVAVTSELAVDAEMPEAVTSELAVDAEMPEAVTSELAVDAEMPDVSAFPSTPRSISAQDSQEVLVTDNGMQYRCLQKSKCPQPKEQDDWLIASEDILYDRDDKISEDKDGICYDGGRIDDDKKYAGEEVYAGTVSKVNDDGTLTIQYILADGDRKPEDEDGVALRRFVSPYTEW